MPTSNLGLVGAFGAGAASDSVQQILKQKFLEAFQRQQLELQQQREAENRRQFDVETGQRGRGLDLEQARLDASMRPKPVDPVLVHGIRGADGKPIQQFVIPQPGQQFEEYEKPPTEKPESAGSDYKQYLARVAKAKGKASADELTVDEELAARKSFGQADDQPRQPIMPVVISGPSGMFTVDRATGQAAPVTVGSGGPQLQGKPSDQNRQTLDYYNRAKAAIADMEAVEDQVSAKDLAVIHNSPAPELINNALLSPAGQQYSQALRAYTLAKLRKESGAAISAGEFTKEGLTAARQVNDTPEVLKQKRNTRRTVLEGFARGAGPAYTEAYGQPYQSQAKTLSESDIQAAMTANKWTREKAVSEAQARGYVVR